MVQLIQPSAKPAAERRFGIVAARFNAEITDAMLDGAVQVLENAGVPTSSIDVVRVPGAFEIPIACRAFIRSERFDAVIALGCIIRGETPHFDFVAGETARGCMQLGLESGIPVVFGVLTADTLAQARHRSATDLLSGSDSGTEDSEEKVTPRSNKGAESAQVALEMTALLEQIQ
ncbi:MAG: 6,7-dimethyl-8-ribityllumazine synthase [Planctomycetes bacterium]|nr:6,7-dimethyl-8-ribityllumazine synthase [Planctomycetota bacterium]